MKPVCLFAGLVVASAALLSATTAMAQGTPTRVRGSISAIDGKTVTIATREGVPVTVKLADNWTVALVAPVALTEIKPNSFVGVASMGSDADRTALEVLVFPEAGRGSGEGHYPWDLRAQSTMTNANVEQTAASVDGQTLTLKYKDGEKKILVTPDITIVTYVKGDKSEIVPGTKIFIAAAKKQADGTFQTPRINYGKDGLGPPM